MKSNLYTGTGDSGMTSLVGGERVSKTCLRLDAYGTIDELSSFLGVVAATPGCTEYLICQILDIQNRLFDVGCYLATSVKSGEKPSCKGIDQSIILGLESHIDRLDSETPKIRAFVLPGGSLVSAQCHVARTVCRRAERIILKLGQQEYVDPLLIRWLNRLSDFLFIAARYLNHVNGVEEIVWQKN